MRNNLHAQRCGNVRPQLEDRPREATRVHHASRRRDSRVAASSAGATVGDAGDRVPQDAGVGTLQGTPDEQAVSASALLEHRTVSSWTVKHWATPFPDNPARPLQKNNPNGLQDEVIRHVRERQQDERLRFWTPAPRRRPDDLLGQASRRQFLDRKRKCRVERSAIALPQDRAAYSLVEVAASAGCRRSDMHRCHGELGA
jgi:hypothetical protein